MAAQVEAVFDAFGLFVFQGREGGQGGGFSFGQEGAGAGLQVGPAGPGEFGGVGDLAEEAAPFIKGSVKNGP